MCGRFTLTLPPEVLAEAFGLDGVPSFLPRYNVAPTHEIAIVRVEPRRGRAERGESDRAKAHRDEEPPARRLALARWGLIPSGVKDPKKIGARMINARQETLFDTAAFRSAARVRRCLVPADGFYEWKKSADGGRAKAQPFRLRLRSGAPFAMAGVFERWRGPTGEVLDTCSVITTTPNALVEPIHDRMPVMLHPEDYALWLDPRIRERAPLERVFVPFPAEHMTAEAVSSRVNDVRNDDPSCIEAPEPEGEARAKPRRKQLGFEF